MTRNFCHNFVRGLMASASLSMLAGPALAASITSLDPLSGNAWTYAYGISGDGSIIVGDSETPGRDAVYWGADGVAHDIGVTGGASVAFGISRDGSTIVGQNEISSSPLDREAWAYHVGDVGYTVLPRTIFGGATDAASAFAANADGSVIVGEQGIDSATVAVMWSGAGWTTETSLGTLGGNLGETSSARSISDDGSVIVGIDGDTTLSGFYWTAGAMHALTAPGQTASEALDISGDGSTIVGAAFLPGGMYAYSWTGPGYATATLLGTLGGDNSFANAVNGDGSVIVGTAFNPTTVIYYAFRYANGTMENLNTLLSNAGVDMTGIVLKAATDVSTDGSYIAANGSGGKSYLVYYNDGSGGGGITTSQAQADSVGALGQSRQALSLAQDAYTGLMTGDLDPNTQDNHGGLTGLVGSATGTLGGQVKLADSTMLLGGITGGSNDYDTFDYNGVLAALALRYDFAPFDDGLQPFAQIGGSLGVLNDLTFKRTYANGAGTATVEGNTSGRVGSLYAKAGVVAPLAPSDQLVFAAEAGERWLSTDVYAESLAGNPFPAAIEAGTDRQTVVKASAKWTHDFTPAIDMTLRAGVGSVVEGSGGVRVATTGAGIVRTSIENQVWAEGGARLGWKVNETVRLDLYATGMSGEAVEANLHVGAGVRVSF